MTENNQPELNLGYINDEIEWLVKNHGILRTSRVIDDTTINIYELRIRGRTALLVQEENGRITDKKAETINGCNRKTFYHCGIKRLGDNPNDEVVYIRNDEKVSLLQEKLRQEWLEFSGWQLYTQCDYEPIEKIMRRTRIYKPRIDKESLIKGKQLLLKFKKK